MNTIESSRRTLMSRARAERIAADNRNAEECGWSYDASPSNPNDPESAWAVSVHDETESLVGYL